MPNDEELIERVKQRAQEVQTSLEESVNSATVSAPNVFPSMYAERQALIGKSGIYSDVSLDYTGFRKYFMADSAYLDGNVASKYALVGEDGNFDPTSMFASMANLFESRSYAVNDVNYSLNNLGLSEDESKIMGDFVSLLVGDRKNSKFTDFYDMIDTAKNFRTYDKRFNHQDNQEISFIVDTGTTNDGLNIGWTNKLSGWGIKYTTTKEGYGKITIPIDNLLASPFFAYAFIECYDNDYSDPASHYDDALGTEVTTSRKIPENDSYFDSWYHRAGNRNQLISINNVTNDREDGTYEYYHNIIEDTGDFLYGSPQYRTRMKEYDDVIKNNSLSREQIEKIAGISWDDYDNERNDLSYKYDDSNIISTFRPIHDVIKFALGRLGYPQVEVMNTVTYGSTNPLANDLENAAVEGIVDSKLLTPALKATERIKNLIGKSFLLPDYDITINSSNFSKTEAYDELSPEHYKTLLKCLNRALADGKVTMNTVGGPTATGPASQIELTFDVNLSDKDYNSSDGIMIDGVPVQLGNKKGIDRWSVRFPADLVQNTQTEALNNSFIRAENQLRYLQENGGQMTLLNGIIPESQDITLQFSNVNSPIRIIYGTNIKGENYSNTTTRTFEVPKNKIKELSKAVALSRGLKASLYQARYIGETHGKDSDLFLQAKDNFETQLGEFVFHLTTTFFDESSYSTQNSDGSITIDTNAFIGLSNSVKLMLGLCNENGEDFDFYDTDRILNWENAKRQEKSNK